MGSLLRSTQGLCLQLCQKQTLDFGIAYYSERFPELPDLNQFREVVCRDPDQFAKAFSQAEDCFRGHNLVFHRWAPADKESQDSMESFLALRGFRRRNRTALALTQWRIPDLDHGVRVLPARAVREQFRRSYLDDDVPLIARARERLAEAWIERLDDPQLDMFVATIDRKPAGRVGIYQVGDIARLVDLAVLPAFQNRSVEESLLAYALGLAKRLTLPSILASVEVGDSTLMELLTSAGFVEDGRIAEFERPTPFEAVPAL